MAAKFDLIGDNAIQSGADWQAISFFVREDVTLWLPVGQIRTDYLDKQNTLIADLQFLPLVYGAVTLPGKPPFNATTIAPKLLAAITKDMPAANKPYVYDIFLVKGLERRFLVGGAAQVLPEVTNV
jgi:hypothetical protein